MAKSGICEICKHYSEDIHRHHIIPRARGGSKGPTIKCCPTCTYQVHVLFTEKELEKMTLEELLSTTQMQKYIQWKIKHPGDYRHKKSRRIK